MQCWNICIQTWYDLTSTTTMSYTELHWCNSCVSLLGRAQLGNIESNDKLPLKLMLIHSHYIHCYASNLCLYSAIHFEIKAYWHLQYCIVRKINKTDLYYFLPMSWKELMEKIGLIHDLKSLETNTDCRIMFAAFKEIVMK